LERFEVKVAFYKSKGDWKNRIIRWWTKSPYSHVELILPDESTWVSISPMLTSTVSKRNIDTVNSLDDWDFLSFELSWRKPVREYQLKQLYNFIEETEGARYDWLGMILSQMCPYLIKHRDKWYCSEWIAHALVKARLVDWGKLQIYSTPNLSPGKLYNLLEDHKPIYK
jgi:hypothetical protein